MLAMHACTTESSMRGLRLACCVDASLPARLSAHPTLHPLPPPAPLPHLLQCKGKVNEWKRKGRKEWEEASRQLLAEGGVEVDD